jgi:hypothetical protein
MAMISFPVLALLAANVGLGLYLGRCYLQGRRSRSLLTGIHLLLGVGALEALAMVMNGTPSGEVIAPGGMGSTSAILIAVAMFGGLLSSLMRGRKVDGAEGVLLAHACAGLLGFVVFSLWVMP